jgi:hypothetical protein
MFSENQNTHLYTVIFFSPKTCNFLDNVEIYGRVEQATDGSLIRRMRIEFSLKAKDTRTGYETLALPRQV